MSTARLRRAVEPARTRFMRLPDWVRGGLALAAVALVTQGPTWVQLLAVLALFVLVLPIVLLGLAVSVLAPVIVVSSFVYIRGSQPRHHEEMPDFAGMGHGEYLATYQARAAAAFLAEADGEEAAATGSTIARALKP